ncbi:MAG TPA: SGNH/GDSL hydrolase family protein [Anaerolineae bacterium]
MTTTDSRHRFVYLLFMLTLTVAASMLNAMLVSADGDPGDDYWIKLNRKEALASVVDIAPLAESMVSSSPPQPVEVTRPVVTQPAPLATDTPTWIPVLSSYARQLLSRSYAAGHDPHLFTIAGDSNSNPIRYLNRVVSGEFDLGKHPELAKAASYFGVSFKHFSMATGGGFRAADMADRTRVAGIDLCHSDEGLYACELRTSNASIVFIQLGTGDKFTWREYENNYRAMLDYAIANNVLPVLVTKADDIESIQGGASYGYINGVIRKLAVEYQLPLVDLYAATRDLPVIPNPALPTRPFTRYGLQDEWGYYFHLNDIGQDRHILVTLQTLAVIQQ